MGKKDDHTGLNRRQQQDLVSKYAETLRGSDCARAFGVDARMRARSV